MSHPVGRVLGSCLQRLKKKLCTVKKYTKNHSCIHHELVDPKATYISSNYWRTILQHKGQSTAAIAEGLNISLFHDSGTHKHCLQTHGANGDRHPPLLNNLLLPDQFHSA